MKITDLTYYVYNTQFGQVTIGSNGEAITGVTLGVQLMSGKRTPTKLTNDCSTQILQYFSGMRRSFDVPICVQGTDFEKRVAEALTKTHFGQTITPLELARAIGDESTYRNVSKAAHANKIAILVPDHRLVPASKFEKPSNRTKMNAALRNLEAKLSQMNNSTRN